MSLNLIKLNNFNKARKTTQQKVTSNISELKALAMDVVKQQIYMWEDPDSNGAGELFDVVNPAFFEQVVQLEQTNAIYYDVIAVANRQMTPEELKTKYSVDLVEFSEWLN